MKTKSFRRSFLLCGLFLTFSLVGCQSAPDSESSAISSESPGQPISTAEPQATAAPSPSATPFPSATPVPDSTPSAAEIPSGEASATKALTISVFNLSNVDIGMFAVIDPVTGEQLNVDSLACGETVSLESNWPQDIEKFHWALYNTDGKLCVDAFTDIAEAQKTVMLLLTGEETIEDVAVSYE